MNNISKISFWLFLSIPSTLFLDKIFASILIGILFLLNIHKIFIVETFQHLIRKKALLFSVIYFFIHAIALSYTKDLNDGLNSLGIILSFLLIPLIGISISANKGGIKINENYLEKLYLFFVSAGILSMIICLFNAFYAVNYGNGSKEYWFFYRGLAEPLWNIHPIYLAYYLNFLLSILLLHNWKLKFSYQLIIKWLIILLTLTFLILLSARTPLIITFAIIVLFIYNKLKIRKSVFVLTSIALLSITIIGLFNTNNRFKELFNENGIIEEDRVQTWKCALEVAENNLFIGVPEGDLDFELEKVYEKHMHSKGSERGYNCHNQYLQQLCYFGIFGLLFFILWLYHVFKASIKTNQILQLLLFSVLVYFCTESLLSVNKGIIFVSYFFTLIAIYEK